MKFISKLNKLNINYCHWKSNNKLLEKFDKDSDLDLLIKISDKKKFEKFISKNLFYKVNTENKYIYHYYGYENNQIIHLHVYYKLITGGKIYKNFYYNSDYLLNNSEKLKEMNIPNPNKEFIFLVARKMFEISSVFELITFFKEEGLFDEIKYLETKTRKKELVKYLDVFELINYKEFIDIKNLLLKKKYFIIFIKYSFRKRLIYRKYFSNNYISSEITRLKKIINILFLKSIKFNNQNYHKAKIISITGTDNSGKSSIIKELDNHFKKITKVKVFHVGQASNANQINKQGLIRKIITKKLPKIRNSNLINYKNFENINISERILISLNSLFLAYRRYMILRKINFYKKKNYLILCDRYISITKGFIDSPKISYFDNSLFFFYLSKFEIFLYKSSVKSDLNIRLSVPFEIIKKRNSLRTNHLSKESLNYLKKSYLENKNKKYHCENEIMVKNNKSKNDSVNKIFKEILSEISYKI